VIATHGRKGTFVRSHGSAQMPSASQAAEKYVAAVRKLGLTRPEAMRLVDESWST
jgi:DNA-binding transcriptional regulator YhcF (GntR family)